MSSSEERTAAEVQSEMKTFLKQQSKNELIRIVFDQIAMYRELQNVCRQLLEEKNALKAQIETPKSADAPKEA